MTLRWQTWATRDMVVPSIHWDREYWKRTGLSGNTPSSVRLAEFDTPTGYSHVFWDVYYESLFTGLKCRGEVCALSVDLGIAGIWMISESWEWQAYLERMWTKRSSCTTLGVTLLKPTCCSELYLEEKARLGHMVGGGARGRKTSWIFKYVITIFLSFPSLLLKQGVMHGWVLGLVWGYLEIKLLLLLKNAFTELELQSFY